jgi:uncharacterized alkaline shock family protein YloU
VKEGEKVSMKVGARLVSFISGIILGAIGCIFFIIAIGQADLVAERLLNLAREERLWALLMSGVTLLLAVLAFAIAFQHRREEKTIIHQTQIGEIQIAVSAVESLALKAAKRIKGVKEAHVGVRADSGLLDVFIEITVHPDLSIPEISEEIRVQVDQYIYETVGIRINSVKVLVTKVAGEVTRSRVE